MPDDQGVQASSAKIDDSRGAQQLEEIKRRLGRRVLCVRILAYVFLTLAIFVLAGGAAVFGFANYIARLTLSPPQRQQPNTTWRWPAKRDFLSSKPHCLSREMKF
jgi:hypothetical protein